MCVSCCDNNYCNVNVPTNSSTAVYDDKISKMRMLAKNLFREREKALTTSIKEATSHVEIIHACTYACFRVVIAITVAAYALYS